MQLLADWLAVGTSCAVVGMAGCGKSNLLGFLSYKSRSLSPYLGDLADKIALIPVDLNSLPTFDLATFFRVILRSFYELRDRFGKETGALVQKLFFDNRATSDPFLSQTALRELLFHFQANEQRVVLVMDRFDRFADQSPASMTDTLRNFRDSFKDTLCYVVGMRQAPKYLLNPDVLGELYEILDLHVCWVGPMGQEDAHRVISEELRIAETSLDTNLVKQIYDLTGGYPSLLKAVCQRYLDGSEQKEGWYSQLQQDQNVRYRLAEIWQGFTQQEQVMLYSLAQGESCSPEELALLIAKGLLVENHGRRVISADLLHHYAAEMGQFSRGMLWEDAETGVLYQGIRPLKELSPTENALLAFFIRHPYKKHTYTDIMEAVWTDEDVGGVSNQALAKQISNLRRHVEPDSPQPLYIVTWRGKPEGGYQFFPEGSPGQ